MSNFIKVDQSDKYRALLTDVLPYELPLWYDNYTMYKAIYKSLKPYVRISRLKDPINDQKCLSEQLIPLDYNVFRGEGRSPRILSIIHPFSQINVCNFYDEYNYLIEYYCSKSSNSLRFPHKIATKFYGKRRVASETVNSVVGVETLEDEPKTASSYFTYLKYPFLYKFFESYEYHKLEKRFSHMMQVDVSKCFPSIYTHTVGWATKTKHLAKSKGKGSFDSQFDSLMQNTNYGETNGIVVGPEFSRIFAEIILQQIDVDIIKGLLENDPPLVEGKDYQFRRYVDDYFVFYKDANSSDQIFKTISGSLGKYKLYLNDAKTEFIHRPFASKISNAKENIREAINQVYEKRYLNDNQVRTLQKPHIIANRTVSAIKLAVSKNDVEYQSISNYMLKALENNIARYFRALRKQETISDNHVNWLLVDIDVLFFFHAMDIRIRPTDRVARVVELVTKEVRHWTKNHQDIIEKKLFDQIRQAIEIFTSARGETYGLETLNLLVMMTLLSGKYDLDPRRLEAYFDKQCKISSDEELYFSFVTFLLYIKDRSRHALLKRRITRDVTRFLLSDDLLFKSTNYFIMFFDFVACPYISLSRRLRTLKLVIKRLDSYESQASGIKSSDIKQITETDFIAPWRDSQYLENSLRKREFVFTYR